MDHPYSNLLDALLRVAPKLRFEGDTGEGLSSQSRAFGLALRALAERERGGGVRASARLRDIVRRIDELPADVRPSAGELDVFRSPTACDASVAAIEAATDRATRAAEVAIRARATSAGEPAARFDAEAVRELCAWEFDDIRRQFPVSSQDTPDSDTSITADRLQAYLSRRLEDPTLRVHDLQPIPGGFGKETYVFTVRGKLTGDLVMRRDMPVDLIGNACHRVKAEYEVIRAVHEAGFPTPKPLWVDTSHESLPGGDFMVMQRSPGVSGGNVFGARATPVPQLSDTIGSIMGRLHALGPLARLGKLTESIDPSLWLLSSRECVRRFLLGYYDLYLRAPHTPSLATCAAYNWLLDNLPKLEERPCLVHGDLGFHNFLLENGRLTAVLDWEFAHIGHPAEDLAYVYNTSGSQLDWPRVMSAYRAAGGPDVTERELLYFRVMMMLRNVTSTNLAPAHLLTGEVADLRLLAGVFDFRPPMLRAVGELITRYDALCRA